MHSLSCGGVFANKRFYDLLCGVSKCILRKSLSFHEIERVCDTWRSLSSLGTNVLVIPLNPAGLYSVVTYSLQTTS